MLGDATSQHLELVIESLPIPKYLHPSPVQNSCQSLGTVYDRIEARAFIPYKSFLTWRLNETGSNLDPGVYFLLATR